MTTQPQALSSVAPITYGYIYSHMRKHQRITTLAILNPGDDFIDGIPCDSVADAAERADGMGVMLLDISEVCEILKQRREVPANVAAYLEQDAFASHEREERQIVAVTPLLDLYPVTVVDALPVELRAEDNIDWIEQDDYVRIARLVRRDDAPDEYGFVLRVNAAVQYALVRFEGTAKSEWFSLEELYLVWKAAALEAGATSAV